MLEQKFSYGNGETLDVQTVPILARSSCTRLMRNSRLHLDFENDTDINPVNYILLNDADVTSLTTWFQGLADVDYRLRRYTLSLVIGCHVDGEAMADFLHMTSESSYHPREAVIFSEAVFDCFYNDYSVVAAFCYKRERYILEALQINDEPKRYPRKYTCFEFHLVLMK